MATLADIPFLSGYNAQVDANRQRGLDELRQAAGLMQLFGAMQAQAEKQKAAQREAQYRTALAGAKTPEEARAIGMQFASPDALLRMRTEGGFTLSPGAQRFDADGRHIASVPPAPEKPSGPEIIQLQKYLEMLPPTIGPDHPMRKGIMARIERLSSGELKAPPSRNRIEGEIQVNEELQPDGTWKETGRGPRFARQVAPVVLPGNQLPKPKSGYQWNEDGSEQVLIKGGPEWNKQKMSAFKDKRSIQGIESNIDDTISVIDQIIGPETKPKDHPGLMFGTGLSGVATRRVPGTEARNFDRLLETLNAKISFDALAKMRAESPTGGALGNVTVRELELLSNSIRPIDPTQSPDDFRKQLSTIRQVMKATKDRVNAGYNQTYSDFLRSEGKAAPAGATGGWTIKVKP